MTKEDVLFILNTAADTSAHQGAGVNALSGAQQAIKAYAKDHTELQDPEILAAIDRLLKVSSAAEVPGVYKPTGFNFNDYVDQKTEPVAPTPTPTPEAPKLWPKKKKWQPPVTEPVVEPVNVPEPTPFPAEKPTE
jgi:hypothetical protein